MADDGELDLNSLSDDDLVQQMHDDLYDALKEEIEQSVNILLNRGWSPYDTLTKALVEGMRIVGIDFRDGILFVPEVLLAANAMKAGMAILRPLLAETGAPKMGKMVIGTVKGDIHGMSALLTTTMPYMKVVIDAMIEKGIRNDHVVLVGGAPLNEAFAENIGADAYCRDAAVAVETAKAYMAKRQGSIAAKQAQSA